VAGLVEAFRRGGTGCAVASFDDYRPGRRTTNEPRGPLEGPLLRIDDEADLERLPEFAEAFAPDLIQLHVDLLWDVAARLRERLCVPLVATLHVCHRRMLQVVDAERESVSLGAQERALAEADLLVAPTRAAADAILADYPSVQNRLRVAGFTVDPAAPAPLAAPRLVTVGRFGAVKGTDRLIALLPHLLQHSALCIDVVGGLPRNPRRDRRWRERILEAAGEHSSRVGLHGWLDPDERDAVLAGARAFLSVSRIESFGLAALEALAHAVPVCGYSEPALCESAPGQLWLTDVAPAAIAARVVELIDDHPRCRTLGDEGRSAIPAWSDVLDAWRTAYSAIGPGTTTP
jgi:glycosyltransferase involved in cell wall biosynthesis